MATFMYILSISLQVAGALLLMFFSLSAKREQIIKRFVNKNFIIRNENEELEYDEGELKSTFRTAYLSKFSFGYIALGYILGIFGDINDSILYTIIGIILGTIVLMVIAYWITSIILKHSKNANQELTKEELANYGLEPNMTAISEKEIQEIWDEMK